ncbi:hypothetical protein GCM10019017_02970 [Streptomyces showdoensis]
MTKVELADGVMYVEVETLVAESASDELEGLHDRLPDLSGVTAALSSLAGQLGDALHQAAPDRAVVEFGCQLGVEAGKLTALVVQGTATANIKVTLEWDKNRS